MKRYAPEIGTPFINHLFAHVQLDRMMSLIIGTGEVISIFVRKKNSGSPGIPVKTDHRLEVCPIFPMC